MKNTVKKQIISVLAVGCTCFLLCGILPAQNSSENPNLTSSGNYNSESPNGYWALTETKTEVQGPTQQSTWTGNPGELSVVMKWNDNFNIQHTVSCKFKWQEPPTQIKPGAEIRMVGTYINSEYSTTNKVLTGLNIILDNFKTGDNLVSNEPSEIVKIARDNRNYENETKVGLGEAPRSGGKEIELKLFVNCYAGTSKYTTIYTYTWVSTGD